jgi:primosomal protein N' (replication factor Y)
LRDEVAGLVPRVEVAEVDAATDPVDAGVSAAPVLVGTEAVLHRLVRTRDHPVRLVAFLTFDEELMATRFRAHEQALWLLVRAARLLGPRTEGGRLLVQTRAPGHAVLRVAASGDPEPFAREEAEVRSELHYPPFGGLAEVSGAPAAVDAAATAMRDAGLTVLGGRDGPALVRAPSSTDLADGLARVDFAPARALGRLRVSVDPPRA